MNRQFKFRVFGSDYMSSPFTFEDLQNKKVSFTSECHVMQFTGLIDKNGVEIYEDDMVQHPAWDYPFQIIFDDERARFVCKMKSGLSHFIANEQVTVIGNIHQP